MKHRFVSLVSTIVLLCSGGLAQQGADKKPQMSTQEIINAFAAAESRNKIARNNYTFTQDVDVMTMGEAGSITGKFRRISDIVYDDLGNRVERISFFPPSTLTVTFTAEDMRDLAGVQPFALTTEDLPKYQVNAAGKEKIDELNLYVFDVKPREIRKGERYFEGRVYVDDEDLQIVKVAGKAVPEIGDQRFPRFETYRENIDGRYWFPTYTYGDDVLQFKRESVRLKIIIKYTSYKRFFTDIRVTDGGGVAPDEDSKPSDEGKPPTEKEKKPESPPPPVQTPKRKPGL